MPAWYGRYAHLDKVLMIWYNVGTVRKGETDMIKTGSYVMVDICGAPIPGIVCSKNGYIATVLLSDDVTFTCHTNKLIPIIPVESRA